MSYQTAEMNRMRVTREREAVLVEEAIRATVVRQNMARLRELRLAHEAEAVRAEAETGSWMKPTT
jgi:hypothetical protein